MIVRMLRGSALLLLCACAVPLTFAETVDETKAPRAMLVWAESQADGAIIYAGYHNEVTQEWCRLESPLHISDNPVTGPSLAVNASQQVVLVWTQHQQDGTELLQKQGILTENEECPVVVWKSQAAALPSVGRYNLGADIAVDSNGQIWAFWSSSTDAPSDIYYASFGGAGWTTPQRLHPANDVPDRDVRVKALEDGTIEVVWVSFDMDSGQSIIQSQIFDARSQQTSKLKARTFKRRKDKLKLPEFVPPRHPAKIITLD